MIFNEDFHVHTTFCDGKNTAEEVVLSAINQNITRLGLVAHTYTPYTSIAGPNSDNYKNYLSEIHRLKEKYTDKIEIWCGVEQDYYSVFPLDEFDYVIGSVHHVLYHGVPISVDESPDSLIYNVKTYFGGDFLSFTEEYYRMLSEIVEITHADIIGHFDLVTKFNEKFDLFDQTDPRYVRAWTAAADALLPYGKPFEINTGGISRGYRTTPYPADPIIDYLASQGASFVLSSDSHSADTLCYQFEHWGNELLLRKIPLIHFDPSQK